MTGGPETDKTYVRVAKLGHGIVVFDAEAYCIALALFSR